MLVESNYKRSRAILNLECHFPISCTFSCSSYLSSLSHIYRKALIGTYNGNRQNRRMGIRTILLFYLYLISTRGTIGKLSFPCCRKVLSCLHRTSVVVQDRPISANTIGIGRSQGNLDSTPTSGVLRCGCIIHTTLLSFPYYRDKK